MTSESEVMRIAIYPSDQVIFPGQVFPLYDEVGTYGYGEPEALKQMMHHCRTQHRPLGIVFIPDKRGYALARIGTIAHIVDANRNIVSGRWLSGCGWQCAISGCYRFTMTTNIWRQQSRYIPGNQTPAPPWDLIENVGSYLRRYTKVMSDLLPPALMPEILEPSAATLGSLSAAILQLPENERQRLLELNSTYDLLVGRVKAFAAICTTC